MDNKPFIMETKFDGERMQLHKKGDEYKYFSRGSVNTSKDCIPTTAEMFTECYCDMPQMLCFYHFSGNDYTVTYGADPYNGNLTPWIANCFTDSLTQCILDGEMVGYDPETETVGKFSCMYSDPPQAGLNLLLDFNMVKIQNLIHFIHLSKVPRVRTLTSNQWIRRSISPCCVSLTFCSTMMKSGPTSL